MSVLVLAKKVEITLMMTENDSENFLPCFAQFLDRLIGWYAPPPPPPTLASRKRDLLEKLCIYKPASFVTGFPFL